MFKKITVLMVTCVAFACITGCASNSPKAAAGAVTATTGDADMGAKNYATMAKAEEDNAYNFDPSTTFQTIDGFGAAYTWYSDGIFAGGKSGKEALDSLFGDAGLSILRFKNEFEYSQKNTAPNGGTMLKYYKGAAERLAACGEKPIVLMCCWSPAAYLKSNKSIVGKDDATLRKNGDGAYCYEEYADWWVRSIRYYTDLGIHVDYVSIQNEVDFAASYDGCRFDPYETKSIASYAKAFVAVYHAFKKAFGDAAPKMLGPETMSCKWDNIVPYVRAINNEDPEALAGIAHHLYVGGQADEKKKSIDASSFITNFMTMGTNFDDLKKWQTEYYIGHAIEQAELINNCLIYENVNAYLFWSGVWTASNGTFENADLSSVLGNGIWSRRAKYYVMRHFSQFIRPGYVRVKAMSGTSDVKTSAYISPDKKKVTIVLINVSDTNQGFTFSGSDYQINSMHAYESVFGPVAKDKDACWIDRGEFKPDATLCLYPKSVMTITVSGIPAEE